MSPEKQDAKHKVIDCISCDEDPEPDDPVDYDSYKCPQSKRTCGHHCNHSWTHDECCWCGKKF